MPTRTTTLILAARLAGSKLDGALEMNRRYALHVLAGDLFLEWTPPVGASSAFREGWFEALGERQVSAPRAWAIETIAAYAA